MFERHNGDMKGMLEYLAFERGFCTCDTGGEHEHDWRYCLVHGEAGSNALSENDPTDG